MIEDWQPEAPRQHPNEIWCNLAMLSHIGGVHVVAAATCHLFFFVTSLGVDWWELLFVKYIFVTLCFLCFQVGSHRSTAAPLLFYLLSPACSDHINMASGDDDDPIIEEVCVSWLMDKTGDILISTEFIYSSFIGLASVVKDWYITCICAVYLQCCPGWVHNFSRLS